MECTPNLSKIIVACQNYTNGYILPIAFWDRFGHLSLVCTVFLCYQYSGDEVLLHWGLYLRFFSQSSNQYCLVQMVKFIDGAKSPSLVWPYDQARKLFFFCSFDYCGGFLDILCIQI